MGIQGEFYHFYSKEPFKYKDLNAMLMAMEKLYDDLQFPMASTESRSFFKNNKNFMKEGMAKAMKDKSVLEKRGDKATFIIQVQYRQNSSWQGEIVWVEENKTQHFRSALELIKLMDGALSGEAFSKVSEEDKERKSG